MKSILIKEGYGLENIRVADQPVPAIQPGQVLVKVAAVSLNQLDLMIAKGAFGTPLPHVPGSDAAGEVAAVGNGVTRFRVGERVMTHFIQDWQSGPLRPEYLTTRLGTDVAGVFAAYISLPETALVGVPVYLTAEQAATLPIAGVTAWEALVNAGQLQAGQTVLLQGTGGVSIQALQLAKAMGARVILTSGNDQKLEQARSLGADETINYRTRPDWQQAVLELTAGKGVDLALEISWAGIQQTTEAMKPGGRIIVVGLLGGATAALSVFGIMQKSLTLQGIQVGSKASFEALNLALAANRIRPVVDRVFPWHEAAAAFRYVEQGNHFGKVVLTF